MPKIPPGSAPMPVSQPAKLSGRWLVSPDRGLTDSTARIIMDILKYVYMFQYDHEENLWMW
jgi:hypothetical protein